MKKILGLDLGTNSIGWALIKQDFEDKKGEIIGMGVRIIPMSQDILGEFEKGNSISQTAERTRLRSIRRLRERHILRRERLHRVLNTLGFLPKHYADKIDFNIRIGKFFPETETKLVYDDDGHFIFKESFENMLADFRQRQPELLNRKNRKGDNAKIPYDWTIYYLRKEALTRKIKNEELAWLLLHFNQKRGYYQSRDEENELKDEQVLSLKIVNVTKGEKDKKYNKYWYTVEFENGWSYSATFYSSIESWINQTRDFVVSTETLKDNTIKRRISSLPTFDEIDKMSEDVKKKFYAKIKLKTENEIDKSNKTVGTYIYDALLQNPDQKIKGKLIRTIERNFYKDELKQILKKQIELNDLLKDKELYQQCIEELYPHNLNHQSILSGKDFDHLFIEDILFYQRPLRSQKSSISNCPLEYRNYILEGTHKKEPLKCIPKSHPLYQEFRLWQWISNLRIYNRDNDANETDNLLSSTDDVAVLFDFLNTRKEVNQETLLKFLLEKKGVKGKELKNEIPKYRWNYIDDKDKKYPCNETHSVITARLETMSDVPDGFLIKEKEEALWHIIYSVTDKIEYEKALKSFARKYNLDERNFYEAFKKFPPFPSDYGAYSAKAINKLLSLMRLGKYWKWDNINSKIKQRIDNLLTGEFDEEIKNSVREKIEKKKLEKESDFQGLPEWFAKYIVYDRHSERSGTNKWNTAADIGNYLKEFKQHSLRNPIVEQVITETLRIVKDIWNHYGQGTENFFDEIHIELGREMKNPAEERKRITEQIAKNENTNLRIKALLAEMLNDQNIENVRPYSPMQQDILKIYEDGVLNSDIEIPEDIEKISKLAQPTNSELQRYKLWLEQKYRSPYTGDTIPLNKLFTPAYEIEHIIPQQRYYDDSFGNKVICESAINKLKDNQTGLEFIQSHHGQIVELGMGKTAKVFSEEEYTVFIKQHYEKSRGKKNKLLSLDIPEKMIARQLNDTRYISRFIMQMLSNIVRAREEDDGMNSKNVLGSNGQITGKLKQDWGLDAVWNDLILPRFERLNQLTNNAHFTVYNKRHQKLVPTIPLKLQKGFNKKRIDHRHHAMDALVIACATRNHINYLNNQNALDKKKLKDQKQKERYDLKVFLCDKKFDEGSSDNYEWVFKQPWSCFVPHAKEALEKIVVSFKQNLRVINKTTNHYEIMKDGKKEKIKQNQGQSWAIRKSLHKDTVYGLISLRKSKSISLAAALDNPENIADKILRKHIQKLISEGYDKKKILNSFKGGNNRFGVKDTSKVTVSYWDHENVASRTALGITFNKERIETITDSGIQKILLKHLENNDETPEVAFSPEGIEDMNKNIVALNNGKQHSPILKMRTYEKKGNKFEVGQTGNKKSKFVEAAKGSNLFFAIYQDENNKRSFEAVPLNIVIERQKQGLLAVPEINEEGHLLLFYLSPNDVVCVPNKDGEFQTDRLYRLTDCSETTANFIPLNVSSLIFSMNKKEQEKNGINYPIQDEFGLGSPQSKNQRSLDGIMIKEHCIKLDIDRLGNVLRSIPTSDPPAIKQYRVN